MAEDKKPTEEKPPKTEDKIVSKDEAKANKKQKDEEFNSATTVHVKIYSPFKTYYDEDAESVSAENLTGPFDILPRHRNFITLLVACEVDIKSKKTGDKKIKINRGVMHVHKNVVTIFLDV